MAVDPDFVSEIVERLEPLGSINSKRMFGGVGIFVDGKMFVKISPSSVLSFKADRMNEGKFLEIGMKKSGKMPYYEATAEQLEDAEQFLSTARLARDAALR